MTTTSFDPQQLTRAIEERDARTQLAAYSDDAEIRLVDKNNPPKTPRVISGRDAISEYLTDVASRDMTHEVLVLVREADKIALTEACRYPDGTNVLCACTAELVADRIVRQTIVQVWDE